MENSLLQKIKSYFTDDVMDRLASNLGEDKELVRKGVDIAVPSLLLGLQSRSIDGLSSVLQSAKHLFSNFDLHDTLGRYFAKDDLGERAHFESDNLTGSIFGDKAEPIIQSVSKYLGMNSSSVSSLFGATIPAVISGITSKGGQWDVNAIADQLSNARSSITAAIPAGLGLGAFGSMFAKAEVNKELQSPDPSRPMAAATAPTMPRMKPPTEDKKKGNGVWWLILPVLALLAWLLFGKGCGSDVDKDTKEVTAIENNTLITPDGNEVSITTIDVALPDGNALKAYSAGIEEQLVEFLQSDYKAMTEEQLKEKWFDFDNLNFETGTADVSPSSQGQLENIAKILKIFPDVKIKIGGYTDKTGDESLNKALSQKRADAVKAYLDGQGLGAQVVGAEGYGSEFAKVAWDASDSEREKDRRVAISVRK